MAKPLWKKGQSGNPAGRPKGSGHVERCKEWAEKKGWDLLEKMALTSLDEKVRLEAMKLLIAYGVGKPTEHREISGNLSLETLLAESIA